MNAGTERRRCLEEGLLTPASFTSMKVFFTPTAQCAALSVEDARTSVSSLSLEAAESREPSAVLSAEPPCKPQSSPNDEGEELRGVDPGDINSAGTLQSSDAGTKVNVGMTKVGTGTIHMPGGTAGHSWGGLASTALTMVWLFICVCKVHTSDKRGSLNKSSSLT